MDGLSLFSADIYIYGTGGNGSKLYQSFPKDIRFLGFVDKNAADIREFAGHPVFTLDEVLRSADIDRSVFFITIKDVFSHTSIARNMLSRGIRYMVFKPENILKGNPNDTEIAIDDIYESFIEKGERMRDVEVPYIDKIPFRFRNRLLIEEAGEEVKAWCPVELLFNYRESEDYPGLNMPLFFPLVELYRSFLGDKGVDPKEAEDNFIDYCCEWLRVNNRPLNKNQRESFLSSRRSVFQEMQKMTEVDIDFFRLNCPKVSYENGKFYLTSSGRNRVAFLIAKGFKYVPVRMSRIDYDLWCDIERVKKIETKIEHGANPITFAPIPNPYLADMGVEFADYGRLFLWPAANLIFKNIYRKSKVPIPSEGDDLLCVDYERVRAQMENTLVICDISDGGVAEIYFRGIGFRTESNDTSTNNAYLISDDLSIKNYKIELSAGSFEYIFCFAIRGEESTEKVIDLDYRVTYTSAASNKKEVFWAVFEKRH